MTQYTSISQALLFLRQTGAVAESDIRKLIHDPAQLFARMMQPVLWLVVFGQVFARTRIIPTGGMPYLDFIAPGILAQGVLFGAVFHGITLIWERDLGILQKFLVSPAPRAALVLGRAVSSSFRSVFHMVVVYGVAYLLGVQLQFGPVALAGVITAVMLGSAIFSTFSLIAACVVKSRERFLGLGQFLTMPLFMASNAIYPLSLMPPWLRSISTVNPLTYQVDVLRTLMVKGGHSSFGLDTDFGIQLLVVALLVGIAAKLYRTIAS